MTSLLISFVVTIAVTWLFYTATRRMDFAAARATGAGLAVGYFAGVSWMRGPKGPLPEWPAQYWHWLPFAGLVMLAATIFGQRLGSLRWIVLTPAAILAAWLLVPEWDAVWPSRPVLTTLLAIYLLLLIWSYSAGTKQTSPLTIMGAFVVASVVMAIAIAAAFSLQYGELAMVFTTSLLGCVVFVFRRNRADANELDESRLLTNLIPCTAVFFGGTAFVSYIYPQSPVYEFLLFPLAPLAWMFAHRLPVIGERIASSLKLRATVFALVLGLFGATMFLR